MKKRATITIDPIVLKEFKEIIKKEKVNFSFVINFLIKEFIELYKGEKDV